MSKRRQTILICTLLAAAGGMAFYFSQQREPQYQGKSLSIWLEDFDHWKGDTNAPVVQAMRSMGTNAATILARTILTKDSTLKKRIVSELARYPNLVKHDFISDLDRWTRAGKALSVMGEQAKVVLPVFLEALTDEDDFTRRAALNGLSWLSPYAEEHLPAIIRLENDPDVWVRANLMLALGRMGRRSDLCIPVLLRGLESGDFPVRPFAASALGDFGSEAMVAVPALAKVAADTNASTARAAMASLKRIRTDE